MHRTGHWLGLDVHDAGEYKTVAAPRPMAAADARHGADRRARLLHPPADDVPDAFWNIGIRIEDDALVTADGCDILTVRRAENRSPTSRR
jgi:Xaa-Pro aminopeptidase